MATEGDSKAPVPETAFKLLCDEDGLVFGVEIDGKVEGVEIEDVVFKTSADGLQIVEITMRTPMEQRKCCMRKILGKWRCVPC